MAESPILGLPQVAPSQNQKEQVVNTAFVQFEAALNDAYTHDTSAGNVTVTPVLLNSYFLHIGTGHSTFVKLLIPARKRIFATKNNGSGEMVVQISPAGSSLSVPVGMTVLIQSDGTTLTKIGSSNSSLAFISLTDAPTTYSGQALKYVRVNSGETALEFVASASVVSGISDFETEYTTTAPVAPATGLELFTRKRAGFNRPATENASSIIDELQFSLHGRSLAFAQANGSASGTPIGTSIFGFSPTTAGTFAPATLDFSSFVKTIRRTGMTTAGTAGALAGLYTAGGWMRRGYLGDRVGGFFFSCRFGIETYVAGMSATIGIWDVAAPLASSDPTAQLTNQNGVILYKNATDTNWKIGRAGGGSVTTVDLGASYPANTSGIDYYELRLFCASAGADVFYSLHRLNTGFVTEGSFSSVLPNAALMAPVIMNTNRAVASAVSMSFSNLYTTTDY